MGKEEGKMQNTLKFTISGVVIGLSLALLMVATQPAKFVSAHEDEKKAQNSSDENTQKEESSNENSSSDFVYKAQTGDSYTKIARKAVQTYGINNNVNLSEAQIVFAETSITMAAGSPELEVGQEVKLSNDSVKKYVEAAQKLSKSEQAAWNVYVPYVDFNTNSVGEAS